MATLSPITAEDAEIVPVTRSYTAISRGPSEITFVDKVTSLVIAAQSTLRIKYSAASLQRKTDRFDLYLALPRTHVVDGIEVVESVGRCQISFIVPDSWGEIDRKNLRTLASNISRKANVKAYVEDRDPML